MVATGIMTWVIPAPVPEIVDTRAAPSATPRASPRIAPRTDTTTASPRIMRRTCRRCMPTDRTRPISLVRSSTESARVLITPTMAMMIERATSA